MFGNARTNKLLLMGGALAGGGATILVAEKAGLSPAWAGAATGGLALAGSALLPNPTLKDACFAAGLGGMGVAGVQLFADHLVKQQQAKAAAAAGAKSGQQHKRQADGTNVDHPFITRDELNQALAQLADKNDDQHKQTCDLMTALHDEIKKVVNETQPHPAQRTPGVMPIRTQTSSAPYLYSLSRSASLADDERNASDDEYMRNAYGDERDASGDDERNAFVDEYERNAYAEERDADVGEERNYDEERNADEMRDAEGAEAGLM